MSLIVHHLGVSQSERIVWLCEELGLPYELRLYRRTRLTRVAPPEYRELHPMGIAPVVEIDGVMLAESGAIVEYIVNRLAGGRLQPSPDDASYADWLFWFHFANGTIMPTEMVLMMLRAVPWSGLVRKAIAPRRYRGFGLIEDRLGKAPWLAGAEFTTAEIMMAFAFSTMRAFSGVTLEAYPNILAWLHRIGERPAYRRAMAAGDPGMTPLLDAKPGGR